MGREATCRCLMEDGEAESGGAEVTALLETHELILRGGVKRRWPLDQLDAVRADGAMLRFSAGGEAVALELGADGAQSWAKKMTAPQPTLRDKLGLSSAKRALVVGEIIDADLAAAVDAGKAGDDAKTVCALAMVRDEAELTAALEMAERLAPGLPIWLVYGKGPKVAFGDAAVRGVMRARGYRDSKSCAVSAEWTATRYGVAKG